MSEPGRRIVLRTVPKDVSRTCIGSDLARAHTHTLTSSASAVVDRQRATSILAAGLRAFANGCDNTGVSKWVRVEKRKYPDNIHTSWEAIELGEDEYGTWLFAPKGVRNSHPASGIELLSLGRWWVAWWWADPSGWWCAVDVATPPSLTDDGWSYDDLEIDVWGDETGFEGVVDEDEFERARLAVPYPALIAESALASRLGKGTAHHPATD